MEALWQYAGFGDTQPARRKSSSCAEELFQVRYDCELGRGTFGTVYEAVDRKGEVVAAKVIKVESTAARDRALTEATIMRRASRDVAHENVLRILGVLETHHGPDAVVVIVMELCLGGELFEAIARRRRYTESDAARAVFQVASGLEALHSAQIAHLDLKPENLLYATASEKNAQLKITDFGLSREFSNRQSLSVRGTVGFVAPEALVARRYGPLNDVFSLGVIAHILLVGVMPFTGATNKEILDRISMGRLVLHDYHWRGISIAAQQIVSDMMQKDPDHRVGVSGILAHPWVSQQQQKEDTHWWESNVKQQEPALESVLAMERTLKRLVTFVGARSTASSSREMMMMRSSSPQQHEPQPASLLKKNDWYSEADNTYFEKVLKMTFGEEVQGMTPDMFATFMTHARMPGLISKRALFEMHDMDRDGIISPGEFMISINIMHSAMRAGRSIVELENPAQRDIATRVARLTFYAFARAKDTDSREQGKDPEDPEGDDDTTIDVENISAGLVKLGKFSYVDVDVEIHTLSNLLRSVACLSSEPAPMRLTVDQWVMGIHRAPLLFECWFEKTVEWWDRLLWRHSECQLTESAAHDRNKNSEFASSPTSSRLKLIPSGDDDDEEYPLE